MTTQPPVSSLMLMPAPGSRTRQERAGRGSRSPAFEASDHTQSMPARWPEATSLLEQARGHERPVVDLPDDLLLAGVVLHDVLSGRVGRRCGLALGGGVAVAVPGIAPQPVAED